MGSSPRTSRALLALLLVSALFLEGCATQRRLPFTASEQMTAAPAGFENIRIATSSRQAVDEWVDAFRAIRARRGTPLQVLSLSGGGANGAYGAGLLYGWSERGDRPAFDIVTGVSTGALAAPFAFLGTAYDETLKASYTDEQTSALLDFQGLMALFSPSLYSGRPLVRLVERFIDENIIAAVAREHAKGRWLLVATTNLDTQDLILWDLGAIAATGGPNGVALFRKVLLASASVPGIFPPVMIDVESNRRRFAEMHVDGSAIASFFAVPESLLFSKDKTASGPQGSLYVLINGKLESEFTITPLSTLPILERSFDTSSKSNTRIALQAVAEFGERVGFSVVLSSMPQGLETSPLNFDRGHMTALFDLGRRHAQSGNVWRPLTDHALAP